MVLPNVLHSSAYIFAPAPLHRWIAKRNIFTGSIIYSCHPYLCDVSLLYLPCTSVDCICIYMLVFLLYFYHLLQNKWWVRLNNQALLDCICIVCMFVFLLYFYFLPFVCICVWIISHVSFKSVSQFEKGNIFRRRVWYGQRIYSFVFPNFSIHHHPWWSCIWYICLSF